MNNCNQNKEKETSQKEQRYHTTFCGFVVHFVVHVLFRIGYPAVTSWCFYSHVMTHNSLPGSAGGNSFGEGWDTKTEFHFLFIEFKSFRMIRGLF